MKQAFNINDRFEVNPSLNTVTDKGKNEESRIEPRLISLLCILSENAGQVVPRESIVKEIWNDYGGGDEALNQAVSVLRKILDDGDKKLIETIPKKGYVLNASVTSLPKSPEIPAGTVLVEKKSRKTSFAIPLAVIIMIALWLIFRNRSHESASPDVLNKDQVQDTGSIKRPSNNSDIKSDIIEKADSLNISDSQKK